MNRVDIETGARLHFGLLCAGRDRAGHFGGVGMMVRAPGWKLHLQRANNADDDVVDVPPETAGHAELVARIHATLRATCGDVAPTKRGRFAVSVTRIIPAHCGFGAGTQLALAIAAGIRTLSGQPGVSAALAAEQCGRAQRSAIGTRGFETGGFLVDFGENHQDIPHRVLSWHVPDAWRFVIVRRPEMTGLSGPRETAVFEKQLQLPPEVLSALQALINLQLVPAVQRADFDAFARALVSYGRRIGEFFAAEQGSCFSDPLMHELADSLRQKGLPEPVQSSWGPATAIPAQSQQQAERILAHVQSTAAGKKLSAEITEALPHGAVIRTIAPESSPHRTWG